MRFLRAVYQVGLVLAGGVAEAGVVITEKVFHRGRYPEPLR